MSSSKKDSLSQWRAYGPYAVGFDTKELRTAQLVRKRRKPLFETPLEREVAVQQVSYGLNESATQAIADILPELSKAAEGLPDNSQPVNALIVPILSRIKHPSFEDEHEWRLLVMGELNGVELQFADGRSAITPHVELVLRPGMISEVMVGPAAHAMLKCDGVRELLHSCGQDIATVSHSESPYRA